MDTTPATNELTPEQIKHWRTALCGMLGPYALIMPVSEIQIFRDKMQNDINNGGGE